MKEASLFIKGRKDMLFLLFVVFVVVVILYYRGKAKYQEAHPRNCAVCNKLIPTGIELADGGVMCETCGEFTYGEKQMRIDRLRVHKDIKKVTAAEAKAFLESIPERNEILNRFTATTYSPSGKIAVDEANGLIRVNDGFVHKISDIESFRVECEFDPGDSHDTGKYTGGHIEIDYNDLYMTDDVRKKVDEKLFDVATINSVKKAYEYEVEFLEKISGKKCKAMKL